MLTIGSARNRRYCKSAAINAASQEGEASSSHPVQLELSLGAIRPAYLAQTVFNVSPDKRQPCEDRAAHPPGGGTSDVPLFACLRRCIRRALIDADEQEETQPPTRCPVTRRSGWDPGSIGQVARPVSTSAVGARSCPPDRTGIGWLYVVDECEAAFERFDDCAVTCPSCSSRRFRGRQDVRRLPCS